MIGFIPTEKQSFYIVYVQVWGKLLFDNVLSTEHDHSLLVGPILTVTQKLAFSTLGCIRR